MILLSFSWEYNLRKTENRSGNGKFSHLVCLFWDRQRQREQDGDKRECRLGKDVAQITEKKKNAIKLTVSTRQSFKLRERERAFPLFRVIADTKWPLV